MEEKSSAHFGAVDYLNAHKGVYLFAASNDPHGGSFAQELSQMVLDILFR
ncbi:MAG: hypothetical protein ABS987_06720 [Ruminococcus sp.]